MTKTERGRFGRQALLTNVVQSASKIWIWIKTLNEDILSQENLDFGRQWKQEYCEVTIPRFPGYLDMDLLNAWPSGASLLHAIAEFVRKISPQSLQDTSISISIQFKPT